MKKNWDKQNKMQGIGNKLLVPEYVVQGLSLISSLQLRMNPTQDSGPIYHYTAS